METEYHVINYDDNDTGERRNPLEDIERNSWDIELEIEMED